MTKKLVFGFGIDDREEKSYPGDPYYVKWYQMLRRCYSEAWQKKKPTYKGYQVCEEWKYFSNFKAWMEKQDWEGKALDKDLFKDDRKLYSPEHCVFITRAVNSFMTEVKSNKNDLYTGVCRKAGKYSTYCNDPTTLKKFTIGVFDCPMEARLAYLDKKLEFAKVIASQQSDDRVATQLVLKYENLRMQTMQEFHDKNNPQMSLF